MAHKDSYCWRMINLMAIDTDFENGHPKFHLQKWKFRKHLGMTMLGALPFIVWEAVDFSTL